MTALIPWPYRWLILAALAAALWGHGYTTGLTHESNRRDAGELKSFKATVTLGNRLSGQLAAKQSATNAKTLEVMRNVPKVTFDRPCLGASAVSLLNDAAVPPLSSPAGKPVDPPKAVAATDRDVAGWIAGAKGQYTLVADQLDALIDYVEGKNSNPEETEEIEP